MLHFASFLQSIIFHIQNKKISNYILMQMQSLEYLKNSSNPDFTCYIPKIRSENFKRYFITTVTKFTYLYIPSCSSGTMCKSACVTSCHAFLNFPVAKRVILFQFACLFPLHAGEFLHPLVIQNLRGTEGHCFEVPCHYKESREPLASWEFFIYAWLSTTWKRTYSLSSI